MIKQGAMKSKMREKEQDDFIELAKAMAAAAVIALFIRSFGFEPFNIPSGSMLPTLEVGDYLFVEKYAYGYSRYSFPFGLADFSGRFFSAPPRRGDIAVFRQPKELKTAYIKRIVGLPGDTVQVKGGILNINGKPVMRDFREASYTEEDGRPTQRKLHIETLPNGVRHHIYEMSDSELMDNTQAYTVPEGHYFAMGDNRDASQDSRFLDKVGFVPAENLIGRAWFIFFSTEGTGGKCDRQGRFVAAASLGCKLVEWPQAIRFGRFFKNINKI